MKPTLKQEISTLLFCLFFLTSFSQETKTYLIKGTIVDSLSKKGLDFVTVALKTPDSKPVKSAVTGAKGDFAFTKVPAGKYKLFLINIGYKTLVKDVEVSGEGELIDLGTLPIAALNNQLKEVTVTGDRPLIKQEVDRIAYDVQADPESKVNNVLDMLRKVPLVTIDADDNIQVKGSGSFKVLINGRPSSLVARSPKDVFKSMPASNIQKIEVITTPPAKYDGEGLAGIINIITNKKIDQGYNGSVTGRYNFPYGPGSNVQLTVKGKKLGISSYVGGNLRDLGATNFALSRTTLGDNSTSLLMSGNRANNGSYM